MNIEVPSLFQIYIKSPEPELTDLGFYRAMYVTKSINANHEDLIHDVAYDFYGKRMATCSSDQKVKVWDQQENGEWVCSARSWTQSKTISSARLGPRKKYRLLSLRIKLAVSF